MATRAGSRDLFWTLTVWIGALSAGAIFAVVIGRITGSGLGAGLFFGAIIFVLTGWFVATMTAPSRLPPPNTLVAPTVPRGMPASARTHAFVPEETVDTVGGKVAKATYHAGEAVRALGSAVTQAATEVGGVVGKAANEVGGVVARKPGDPATRLPDAAEAHTAPLPEPMAEPAPRLADLPAEPALAPAPEGSRPAGLSAARDGGADDLKKIKGVGPKLEELLHSLGFYHFDQVAAWTPAEIAWVDSHLEGFNGRATRDDWVGQANILSAGGETEFSQRVDKGEIY